MIRLRRTYECFAAGFLLPFFEGVVVVCAETDGGDGVLDEIAFSDGYGVLLGTSTKNKGLVIRNGSGGAFWSWS